MEAGRSLLFASALSRRRDERAGSGENRMGCCDFDLLEMRLYRIVAKVKNQHRTGNVGDAIGCHRCDGNVEHEFVKRQFIGFTVRIACVKCGWEFEG